MVVIAKWLCETHDDFLPIQLGKYEKGSPFELALTEHICNDRIDYKVRSYDSARLVRPRPDLHKWWKQEAACDEQPQAPDAPSLLTDTETRILCYLRELHPQLRNQLDIGAGADIARATVSKCLKGLREAGLVHRPKGQRKGEGLTDKGKVLADQICSKLLR